MIFSWLRKIRRNLFIPKTWPEKWTTYLDQNVRLSWHLTEPQLEKLKRAIQIIVAEKNWEGVDGFQIEDEHKVTIAAQMGIMLLGVEDFYFENVRSILIHPTSFVDSSQKFEVGNRSRNAGQAWQSGPVILSWYDTIRGGKNEDDGRNVVIHEFAHTLDGLDGEMGGNLIFPTKEDNANWQEVSDREYQKLVRAAERGRRTFLDPYGATNKAEFFAVAVESFFEEPNEMEEEHSQLFHLLRIYFRIDPRQWHTGL